MVRRILMDLIHVASVALTAARDSGDAAFDVAERVLDAAFDAVAE